MKILFICTHNRCRSILSEAITNSVGIGVITAKSAGSQPAGVVHPLSLKYLEKTGHSVDGLRSQSWDEFEEFGPDLVITVCDSATGESCPLYFGKSLKMHWGLTDPSKVEGTDAQKEAAFLACITKIETRAEQLKHLATEALDKSALKERLNALGASY